MAFCIVFLVSSTPGKAGGLKNREPLKAVDDLVPLKAATDREPLEAAQIREPPKGGYSSNRLS